MQLLSDPILNSIIGGLKKGGLKFVSVAVFFSVVALIAGVLLGKLFGLEKGYVAGMLGGALTPHCASNLNWYLWLVAININKLVVYVSESIFLASF